MAFVSIDNPDGIQHHGGQMDWCRISATRVVMVNYTKDNKALLQEINYNAGVTELGPATFLKQVPAGGPTYRHLRSFVRDMGAGRVFVMVPTIFSNMATGGAVNAPCAYLGAAHYASLAATSGTPIAWTCMTAVRNGDGTYTVDSSIDINMAVATNSNSRDTHGYPVDIFISGTEILVRALVKSLSTNRWEYKATLTVVDGKITSQAVTNAAVLTQAVSTAVTSVREKRTPAGDVVRIYTYMVDANNSGAAIWSNAQNLATAKLTQNPYTQAADLPWPNIPLVTGMFANPAVWLPISKTDPLNSLHCAGLTYWNNGILPNYLNGNQTDGGIEMYNPLDAAWVTNNVACIVGFANKYIGDLPGVQPPYLPGDMAFTVNPAYYEAGAYGTVVRKLSLSFRSMVGSGIYVSPFDALDTGFYFKNGMNCGDMIHRIDDTAFWLIGCFMDGPTADPKLGVITVKA